MRECIPFRSITPLIPGLLRRYVAHPAILCHMLPPSLSFEDGALLEPLSFALAAVKRSKLRLGDPALICGAGPVGLTMLLCACHAGAHPLVITDLDAGRLTFAESLAPGRVRALRVAPEEAPGARGADRGGDGGQGAGHRTGVHGSGGVDRGRDRGGQDWRGRVRRRHPEERELLPGQAAAVDAGGEPRDPVPVSEHVSRGDSARGGWHIERCQEAGDASVSYRGCRACV